MAEGRDGLPLFEHHAAAVADDPARAARRLAGRLDGGLVHAVVAECGDPLRHRLAAVRADALLLAVAKAGRLFDDDGLPIGMPLGRDYLLLDEDGAADRTEDALGKARFGAGRRRAGDDLLGVARRGDDALDRLAAARADGRLQPGLRAGRVAHARERPYLVAERGNDLLRDDDLAAGRAVRTFGEPLALAAGRNAQVGDGHVRQDVDRHVVDALVTLLVEIIVAAFITMPILHTARRIAGGLDGGMIDHRVPVRARTEQKQQHNDKDDDEGDDDRDADDDFLFVLFGLFGGAVLLRHLFFFCHSPSFVFAKHDERTAGCPAWPCARPPEGCSRTRTSLRPALTLV